MVVERSADPLDGLRRLDLRAHHGVEARISLENHVEVPLEVGGGETNADLTARVEPRRQHLVDRFAGLGLPLGSDRVLEVEDHDVRVGRRGLSQHLGPVARREQHASSGHAPTTASTGLNPRTTASADGFPPVRASTGHDGTLLR